MGRRPGICYGSGVGLSSAWVRAQVRVTVKAWVRVQARVVNRYRQ